MSNQVYFRYDCVYVKARASETSMANSLPSSQSTKRMDNCRGIHGSAKKRKGAKHATVTARRRIEKELIKDQLED